MTRKLTLADIICNAFDESYSFEQAAIDFGELKIGLYPDLPNNELL